MTTPQKAAKSTLETPPKPPRKGRRGTQLPGGPLWKKLIDTAAPGFKPPDTPPAEGTPREGPGQAAPLESASGAPPATEATPTPATEPRHTMPNDTAAPSAEPATIITTTVRAAAAPEAKASMLESLFGPKKSTVAVYVHPTDPLTGRRMSAIMVIPQDEEPEVTATRLATLKPGTYTMIEKNGTEFVSTQTHVVEDNGIGGREASAVTVHHPAPPMDVSTLLMGLQSMMREVQAANNEAMTKMQMENLRAQNSLLETMMKARGDTVAAASGMPPEIMQMLIAKAFAPAPSALSQLKELQQMQNIVGGTEEGPFESLAKNLGPVLTGLMAQAQQGGKPAAAKPLRTVALPAIAAPGEPAAAPEKAMAAETPPASQGDQLAKLVDVIERMAARNVEPDTAIVALSAIMDAADFEQVTTLVTIPGALDQLTAMAPSLAPYRAWLEALAEAIKGSTPDTSKGADNANADKNAS